MPEAHLPSLLTGLRVREAVRRQFLRCSADDPLEKAISGLIKFKSDAVLVTDVNPDFTGVVTKTDLMSAYYASCPVQTPLGDIMSGPPIFCREEAPIESALELMQEMGVHQVFVEGETGEGFTGILTYTDIVGLMYRFCRNCVRNHLIRQEKPVHDKPVHRFRVREVMTDRVIHFYDGDSLYRLMETLSENRFWALFTEDSLRRPSGVVSKTDLILAYKRGVPPTSPARDIMTRKICVCPQDVYLAEAIQQMIFQDVHRLFVFDREPAFIRGVISFTDAARIRSGSCRACFTTRIKIDAGAP